MSNNENTLDIDVSEMTVNEVEQLVLGYHDANKMMLRILQEWLPMVMKQYSMEMSGTEWSDNLHETLPKLVPSIHVVTTLLGQVPSWETNAIDGSDGYQIVWRDYD